MLRSMWDYMSDINPSGMMESSSEGFQKVLDSDGDYGFIWDSPVIDYKVKINCSLMRVGEPIGSKGYGLGVPRGAKYRDDLTMAILKLSEEGYPAVLEEK